VKQPDYVAMLDLCHGQSVHEDRRATISSVARKNVEKIGFVACFLEGPLERLRLLFMSSVERTCREL
jgi:hypothetical protein